MLNCETGWESLHVRRSKHKLCLFYKIDIEGRIIYYQVGLHLGKGGLFFFFFFFFFLMIKGGGSEINNPLSSGGWGGTYFSGIYGGQNPDFIKNVSASGFWGEDWPPDPPLLTHFQFLFFTFLGQGIHFFNRTRSSSYSLVVC